VSLKPSPVLDVPELTARIARAAFPKGNPYLRLRDQLGPIFRDPDFANLYPRRGQPALPPWKLALVTVMQFSEDLSDRQAADAFRGRIDRKYALGLKFDDPAFNFSVLSEFRGRLVTGGAGKLLLDEMLEVCKDRGLLTVRARQRTNSTHVLAVTRDQAAGGRKPGQIERRPRIQRYFEHRRSFLTGGSALGLDGHCVRPPQVAFPHPAGYTLGWRAPSRTCAGDAPRFVLGVSAALRPSEDHRTTGSPTRAGQRGTDRPRPHPDDSPVRVPLLE
jgi:transposase